MTPVELALLLDGFFWRQDQERQFLSTMFAAVINTQTKKRIKPTDLYKPVSERKQKKKTALDKEAYLKRFEDAVKQAKSPTKGE